MSRINTNINSLISQRVLQQNQAGLSKTLERLSTGYRINRGGDDPAGLIASERLRSEKAALAAAIGNAERAEQVVNVAEGGLQEISALLTEMQGLVSQVASDAGISDDEKKANQLQIDSILQTIDRLAATTSFAGTKLLNGNYDFDVTGVASTVSSYEIRAAKFAEGDTLAVKALVTQSARHGAVYLSMGAAAIDLGGATSSFVFEVTGAGGTKQFSFGSGSSLSDIAAAITTFKDVTGVSAVASGNYIELKSTGFGSSEFVSFNLVNDGGIATGGVNSALGTNENAVNTAAGTAFAALTGAFKEEGQDIGAVVNGVTAQGDGKKISINNEQLDIEVILNDTRSQTVGNNNVLTIAGGGARFNLGPDANLNNQVILGIRNVNTTNLGSKTTAFINTLASGGVNNLLTGDIDTAQQAVNAAIDQVSGLRGRLGAFQKNTVGATIRTLGVSLENISAAESAIRDTDFAEATAELARNQILVQAASSMLNISNAQSQNVLFLLQ